MLRVVNAGGMLSTNKKECFFNTLDKIYCLHTVLSR